MGKHLAGSSLVYDDAIGPYRQALADLLGCSVDTLDKQCSPPADFTPTGRRNVGRRNPLDELHAVATHCPNGMHAVRWLAEQLGYRLVPIPDAHQADSDTLIGASPAMLVAAMEKLSTEMNRPRAGHPPKLSLEHAEDLRDAIFDRLHALFEDYKDRRQRSDK